MLAPDGNAYNLFTFENDFLKVIVTDWGASWLSCQKKTENGLQEMLLGCDLKDFHQQSVYMGATVGRFANRIANAQFELNGKTYTLTANQNGKHQLHGGKGFSHLRWAVKEQGEDFITFSHFSPDGDDGFPGNCTVETTYRLIKNTLRIEYEAISDQNCPINLTNHAYFNLDNADDGCDVRNHWLEVQASHFLPVNEEGIPFEPLTPVEKTAFDFQERKLIKEDFGQGFQTFTKGYDHSFLLKKDAPFAVKLCGQSGNILTVETSQPAVQIYTGNYLGGTPSKIQDKSYSDFAGIALETQALPDTPNHPEWWQYGGISKANEPYEHWTNFTFE